MVNKNESLELLRQAHFVDLADQDKIVELIGNVQQSCIDNKVEFIDASNIVQTTVDETGEQQTVLNLGDSSQHQLQIFPLSDGRGAEARLVYSIMAITPKFESVLESKLGLEFLKQSYESVVTKKIRDNVRNAVANKRIYTAPKTIEDFLTTSRATTGSEAFKKLVVDLVKGLRAKYSKFPTANAVITQKTLLEGFKCEALAKQVFSFMINPETGETILGKLLENARKKFVAEGEPTTCIDSLIETRLTSTIEDSQESEDDNDLFNIDDLV